MGAVVLDRKKLGRNAFWGECKTATRASRPVEIRTGCKEWEELPSDIKFLYYLAERRGTIRPPVDDTVGYTGAVAGIPSIAKEILKLMVALAAIVLAIVFVSKKYKFTIEVGPDGTIIITGEPT